MNEIDKNLGSINIKLNNVGQNIYNQIKKSITKDHISINDINRYDNKLLDKKGEIILYIKILIY